MTDAGGTAPPQELIDIGANLAHDSFEPDRREVIERAAAAGVTRLIITGSSVASSHAALSLSREYPGRLFATAGMHPHHATDYDDAADASFRELAGETEVVAVGECGLDYFRNFSPADAQRLAFERQLKIAIDVQKPVFLHQRDAHDDFVAMLKPVMSRLNGGVAHCFTGNRDEMRAYLDMGLYIGITGWICDERRGEPLRQAVRFLPLDRLLLETDAPYLLPRDLKARPDPRRNEPSVLPHICDTLARYMENTSPADVAAAAAANTCRLFGLP